MNRPESLKRLCNSLKNTNFLNDTVNIDVYVDAIPKTNLSDVATKVFLDNFEWRHGKLNVFYESTNIGLRNQWMRKITHSSASMIIEDDLIVSPDFYKIAKELLLFVKQQNNNNIFSIAINRLKIILQNDNCPYFNISKCLINFVKHNSSFFIPLMSTWGPIVFRDSWNALVDFYNDFYKISYNLPCIPGAITNKWLDTSGTFMQYYVYKKSLFVMYLNIDSDIVYNTKAKGLHYTGKDFNVNPYFFNYARNNISLNLDYVFDQGFNALNIGLNSSFNLNRNSKTNCKIK